MKKTLPGDPADTPKIVSGCPEIAHFEVATTKVGGSKS